MKTYLHNVLQIKLSLWLTLFFINTISAFAQEDAINTGDMYISTGTIVADEGAFTTSPSGNTENGGDFYLKGNWTNNGTYITSIGTVTFWGTNAQTINGTSGTVYYNAIVDKPSNGVTLNVNTEVSNILSLTNGEVDMNSNTITISNSATTGIGYTNGYLLSERTDNSSKVQWNIGSTTGAHIVPFGKSASVIIPLTLDLTSGTIGNVTTSTYPTDPANTPYPVTPVAVANVNGVNGLDNSAYMVDRFWEIDKTGVSGTLTVTFTYDEAEKPANGEANLVSQRYSSTMPGWDPPAPSQIADAVANTVTTPGVTTYGPYVLTQSSSPLPVELLGFNAVPNKQKEVDLTWATASEQNSNFFTIERSKDGKNFEAVKNHPAAGFSTSNLYYKDIDKNPFDGISYYRLKQTDFNGSYMYSEIKTVNINESKFDAVSVFPNPAISSAAVYFTNSNDLSGSIKTELYDGVGKLVASKEFTSAELIYKDAIVIERNNIAAGLYSLKILKDNRLQYTGKIIFK